MSHERACAVRAEHHPRCQVRECQTDTRMCVRVCVCDTAQVGSYKLPPELKKKAETARAKTESDLEAERRKERLDALAQRKMEKLAEEKVRRPCIGLCSFSG